MHSARHSHLALHHSWELGLFGSSRSAFAWSAALLLYRLLSADSWKGRLNLLVTLLFLIPS